MRRLFVWTFVLVGLAAASEPVIASGHHHSGQVETRTVVRTTTIGSVQPATFAPTAVVQPSTFATSSVVLQPSSLVTSSFAQPATLGTSSYVMQPTTFAPSSVLQPSSVVGISSNGCFGGTAGLSTTSFQLVPASGPQVGTAALGGLTDVFSLIDRIDNIVRRRQSDTGMGGSSDSVLKRLDAIDTKLDSIDKKLKAFLDEEPEPKTKAKKTKDTETKKGKTKDDGIPNQPLEDRFSKLTAAVETATAAANRAEKLAADANEAVKAIQGQITSQNKLLEEIKKSIDALPKK
jgi:hypothetical protein